MIMQFCKYNPGRCERNDENVEGSMGGRRTMLQVCFIALILHVVYSSLFQICMFQGRKRSILCTRSNSEWKNDKRINAPD